VTAYPVMVDGSKVSALVVGGGSVALRKVRALLDAGIRTHLVAIELSRDLRAMVGGDPRLEVSEVPYDSAHIGDAFIVIAATNDPSVNARVADDARRQCRLVNVVDAPSLGNFVTPAVHRAGDLTIAVSAGRLPAAAGAIRDAIADRFDDRYSMSIAELRDLRDRLIADGDRDAWKTIVAELLGADFCAQVESGSIAAKVDAWR
jgi:precorrin-2 dehydrogenase / sirohydrochlorin ferrochelatase